METKHFKRNFVMEEVLTDPTRVLVDEPVDSNQWFSQHLLVFKDGDECWQTVYNVRHNPEADIDFNFEFSEDMECVRVWPVEVKTTAYATQDPMNMSDEELKKLCK